MDGLTDELIALLLIDGWTYSVTDGQFALLLIGGWTYWWTDCFIDLMMAWLLY